MMPENKPPLNDEERADLVAYLDGQLDDRKAEEIAARLSLDPQARAEADALNRVWDLLDYLPKTEPSPTFTHRTMERLSTIRPVARPLGRRRWVLALGWAASVLLALTAGFAATAFLLPRDRTEEKLVRDLRVLENHRLYEPIDDLDFLLELSHPDAPNLFGDDVGS
jgi:anti-sigma factor RsiW